MKRRRIPLFLGGVAILVIVSWLFFRSPPARSLRFVALDVGQGDALFIEAPTGEQMLVDGGPSHVVLEKLGRAMPLFDRTIDVVVLTHPDADHIAGLVGVLGRYRVKKLLLTGVTKNTAVVREFWRVARERKVSAEFVRRGSVVHLSSDVAYSVLFPTDEWLAKKKLDTNDTSVIGRLDYRAFSLLLPGDASEKEEAGLLATQQALSSTVLKVGHHGSRTSTTEALLDAVRPSIAIISVGADNSYGHPTPATLKRLQQRHIPFLRTDLGSDIILESRGDGFSVKRGLGFRVW